MIVEPTAEQNAQCAIVQQEVVELVNRLCNEGIDRRVVIAGLSAATAASVLTFYGPAEVSVWFARPAAMTMHLAG